jgi:hypothetical protein
LVAHSYNLSYIECKSGPRQKAWDLILKIIKSIKVLEA